MKSGRLVQICLFLLSALIMMSSCEEDPDMRKRRRNKQKYRLKHKKVEILPYVAPEVSVIDFDTPELSGGDIVYTAYSADGIGPVVVRGINPRFGSSENAAMIFDSNKPTGRDPDLCTPHRDFGGKGRGEGGKHGSAYENKYSLNNVLMVSENLNPDNPDDEGRHKGAELIFDFSKVRRNYNSIVVQSIDILDIEQTQNGEVASVEFLDEDLKVLKEIQFPVVGDNGYARVELPYVPFVNRIVVRFTGSGAVDNIAFKAKNATCTLPKDFFAQNAEEWEAVDANETFFLCTHNYFDALTNGVQGSGYYSLSEQYITAKLNVYNGAPLPREVKTAITMAEDLFNYYGPARITQLPEGDPLRKMFMDVALVLDNYNTGKIGPGMCTQLVADNEY